MRGKEKIKMEIYEIIAVCMLAAAMILLAVKMIMNKEGTVRTWLIMAVTVVEKKLGSGEGEQKLMKVYKMFIERFPVFSVFISFETFSRWVDIALDSMKALFSIEENCYGSSGVLEAIIEKKGDV